MSRHFWKPRCATVWNKKSFRMLELLYRFLMTKLCRTFMITLWIVLPIWKTHSRNLEHCFTDSMTAH